MSWSASALGTYEVNGYNSKKDYTKGNYMSVDWGIVHNLNPTVTLGLVGYSTWQTNQDHGPSVRAAYTPVRDYSNAIGGELTVAIPEANNLSIGLRHLRDVNSFGRLSGNMTTLTFSFPITMKLPSAPSPATEAPAVETPATEAPAPESPATEVPAVEPPRAQP